MEHEADSDTNHSKFNQGKSDKYLDFARDLK